MMINKTINPIQSFHPTYLLTQQDAYTDEEGFIVVESDDKNNCKFKQLTKSSSNTLNLVYSREFDTCDGHDYVIEVSVNTEYL